VSNGTKQEYLRSIQNEYQKADRREKSVILKHAIWVTKLSRKRLIRLLNRQLIPTVAPRRGRKPKYGPELAEPLKALWFLMEQPCGKKLKVLIPKLLIGLRRRDPRITEDQAEKLLAMSAATIDRFLKQIRVRYGVSTTKPPSSHWYKTAIPVQARDWNIKDPGYAQVDTVSHCGESGEGAFASTLTLTDIDSHWTEMRATFTKQHQGIIRALRDIENHLPFALRTLKFDSGSEFMNFGVVSYCRSFGPSYGREKPIQIYRSRPYRKNDNCYVEQKNLTHVRQFIGYDRIENKRATELLDELYKNLWCPFLNFFMPTFKLISKERVGSKIKKKHETPKTPYERILESAAVSEEQKTKLTQVYQSLDPFELKIQIEEKLKLFFEANRTKYKPGEELKLTG
jgi:hypothetical protein